MLRGPEGAEERALRIVRLRADACLRKPSCGYPYPWLDMHYSAQRVSISVGRSETQDVFRILRARLVQMLGGITVDPTPLGTQRDLIRQEFQLRLLRSNLFETAETRADLVESAARLADEAADKVAADAALVEAHAGEGPSEEEQAAAAAVARVIPSHWQDM